LSPFSVTIFFLYTFSAILLLVLLLFVFLFNTQFLVFFRMVNFTCSLYFYNLILVFYFTVHWVISYRVLHQVLLCLLAFKCKTLPHSHIKKACVFIYLFITNCDNYFPKLLSDERRLLSESNSPLRRISMTLNSCELINASSVCICCAPSPWRQPPLPRPRFVYLLGSTGGATRTHGLETLDYLPLRARLSKLGQDSIIFFGQTHSHTRHAQIHTLVRSVEFQNVLWRTLKRGERGARRGSWPGPSSATAGRYNI